jgi:hypothetical protein
MTGNRTPAQMRKLHWVDSRKWVPNDQVRVLVSDGSSVEAAFLRTRCDGVNAWYDHDVWKTVEGVNLSPQLDGGLGKWRWWKYERE